MTSINDYKSFPVHGINKQSAITLLTILQTAHQLRSKSPNSILMKNHTTI